MNAVNLPLRFALCGMCTFPSQIEYALAQYEQKHIVYGPLALEQLIAALMGSVASMAEAAERQAKVCLHGRMQLMQLYENVMDATGRLFTERQTDYMK